jgi:hypothetical protein
MTSPAEVLQLRRVFTDVRTIVAGNYFYLQGRVGLFQTDRALDGHLKQTVCFRHYLNGYQLFSIVHMLNRLYTTNSVMIRIGELSTQTDFNIKIYTIHGFKE